RITYLYQKKLGYTELSVVKIAQTITKPNLVRKSIKTKLSKTQMFAKSGFQNVFLIVLHNRFGRTQNFETFLVVV
ncbi:hypothetical protein, partial [Crocosphaera watsonii]|uniref:hypothetical protein n=1 Tax=Crocosphaera watsonii TaxID=263511 RepID=UPI00065049AC